MATSKAKAAAAELSTNNLIMVLAVISLVAVAATAVVAKAMVTGIVRDNKVRVAQEKANKQLGDDLTAAPLLVDAYKNLGPKATTLSDALPNTQDFPSLIVSLENMANDAGVKLKSVAPSAVVATAATTGATTGGAAASAGGVQTPTPQPYPFSVEFDGTFANLQKLLANIELSARPMRVTSVQMNGSGSSLSGEIDMQTYYQDKATLPISTETIK